MQARLTRTNERRSSITSGKQVRLVISRAGKRERRTHHIVLLAQQPYDIPSVHTARDSFLVRAHWAGAGAVTNRAELSSTCTKEGKGVALIRIWHHHLPRPSTRRTCSSANRWHLPGNMLRSCLKELGGAHLLYLVETRRVVVHCQDLGVEPHWEHCTRAGAGTQRESHNQRASSIALYLWHGMTPAAGATMFAGNHTSVQARDRHLYPPLRQLTGFSLL